MIARVGRAVQRPFYETAPTWTDLAEGRCVGTFAADWSSGRPSGEVAATLLATGCLWRLRPQHQPPHHQGDGIGWPIGWRRRRRYRVVQ